MEILKIKTNKNKNVVLETGYYLAKRIYGNGDECCVFIIVYDDKSSSIIHLDGDKLSGYDFKENCNKYLYLYDILFKLDLSEL